MKLHPNIKYRSDIDGLRALAVLSVILFHINSSWIPGGFLGVDIFFVISGYLITLILTKEIDSTDTISISNFYKRRVKRIIPALLFVLIPTLIVGFLLFAPNDFASLLKSNIWAFFSAANIYFFSSIDTGYFARGSDELPLLHLWSLGVEEQFYILWPFIVLFLLKYIHSITKRIVIISSIFIASLILAQLTIVNNHSFAYYMLPTRAWELLSGATVALLVHNNFRRKDMTNEIMATIGFVTIILSFIFVSKSDSVPGLAALPTILGTSLLILSGISYHTYIGRILSFKLFVAIGLVSYSAYLWHWPILAFLRYSMVEINLYNALLILALTFIFATISYFFIETPLRKNNLNNKQVFIKYFIIPALIIVTFSTLMLNLISLRPAWIYSEKKLDKSFMVLQNHRYEYCYLSTKFNTDAYKDNRYVYPKNHKPTVFLTGDSNAAHYLGMIRVFADHYGFTVRNASQSACPPVFNNIEYPWIGKKYREGCLIYRNTIFKEAIKYDTVILGGNWSSYDYKEFRSALEKTIDKLSKNVKKVIVLGKIPIMKTYSKDCAIRSLKMRWIDCAKKFKNSKKEVNINKFVKQLTEKYSNVSYFDIRNQTCKGEECSPYLEGKPLYYDRGHLSMSGSKLIGETMIKTNDPMLKVFEKITND
jgi:peptidoglycan/LPS O-acetylase OafA/YrhL